MTPLHRWIVAQGHSGPDPALLDAFHETIAARAARTPMPGDLAVVRDELLAELQDVNARIDEQILRARSVVCSCGGCDYLFAADALQRGLYSSAVLFHEPLEEMVTVAAAQEHPNIGALRPTWRFVTEGCFHRYQRMSRGLDDSLLALAVGNEMLEIDIKPTIKRPKPR